MIEWGPIETRDFGEVKVFPLRPISHYMKTQLLTTIVLSACLLMPGCFEAEKYELSSEEMIIQDSYRLSGIEEYDEYEWEVTLFSDSGDWNVYWLDDMNCQQWENGKPFVFISALSNEDMTQSGSMGPVALDYDEEYCFIIENNGWSDMHMAWVVSGWY